MLELSKKGLNEMIPSQLPAYNLKAVIQETGISADTLRAWERRYGIPKPERTPGGHRLYSQRDIETVKWLMARQEEGLSISRAVQLWNKLTAQGENPIVDQHSGSLSTIEPLALETLRNDWVEACLEFNEPRAEQIISQAFALYPTEIVCADLLQRGMHEIGDLWYAGKASVQNEHFASGLVTRRMDTLIAATPPPTRPETILVGCPPNEWHVLSLLIIVLFLRRRGLNVINLGANIPLVRFNETVQSIKPQLVILASQQLHSADSLLATANGLAQVNIRVAYGGRIFKLLPRLREQIPGYYLGDNLQQGIEMVEELLANQAPPLPAKPLKAEYEQLKNDYARNRSLIEMYLMQSAAKENLPLDAITIANQYLGDNLLAAMSLGDLSLTEAEIDWVENMLNIRSNTINHLATYLSLYARAVKQATGEKGSSLVEWLQTTIEKRA
jgi:DNA-binding transcriptional MerR regulator